MQSVAIYGNLVLGHPLQPPVGFVFATQPLPGGGWPFLLLRHPRYRIYTIIPDTTLENYDEALNIGVNARKRGALQLAIVALTRAVELNPLPSARAALAGAYRASGRLETAEQLY